MVGGEWGGSNPKGNRGNSLGKKKQIKSKRQTGLQGKENKKRGLIHFKKDPEKKGGIERGAKKGGGGDRIDPLIH